MRLSPIVPVFSAILLAGCASPNGAGVHAGDPFVVTAQRSLFYIYGPAQAKGPDFALSHGTRVTMLSYEYGYSHVAIPVTGETGYVPTEDLAPAPPGPSPTPAATPGGHGHHRQGPGSRPPTAGEQSQIPLPEFPESKPPANAPTFRY